ncbi:DMP19 family protein [Chitinophaga varians]|uniref:DMP19 family protein n=1 Tax=Chitinophaga varians TaxID=2202339 RepID=UPI001CB73ACE|nr:DUF4375 domain-containing protein [Chitinophaga varians]
MDEQRQAFEDYSFEITGRLFDLHGGKLELLTEEEQEVVRIWRLEADMYNGGFLQYFCNWGYENFEKTQQILAKLGAVKSLAIITEYEKTIAVLKEEERIKELWDIPKYLDEYLNEDQQQRLNELDELYWENPDDIQLLGYNYYLKQDA